MPDRPPRSTAHAANILGMLDDSPDSAICSQARNRHRRSPGRDSAPTALIMRQSACDAHPPRINAAAAGNFRYHRLGPATRHKAQQSGQIAVHRIEPIVLFARPGKKRHDARARRFTRGLLLQIYQPTARNRDHSA